MSSLLHGTELWIVYMMIFNAAWCNVPTHSTYTCISLTGNDCHWLDIHKKAGKINQNPAYQRFQLVTWFQASGLIHPWTVTTCAFSKMQCYNSSAAIKWNNLTVICKWPSYVLLIGAHTNMCFTVSISSSGTGSVSFILCVVARYWNGTPPNSCQWKFL